MVKPQKTTNKLHPFPRTGNVARSRFFTIVAGLLAVVGIVFYTNGFADGEPSKFAKPHGSSNGGQ